MNAKTPARPRFSHYQSVTYWPSMAGVAARFRGEYSDCCQWFPNMTEFRRAARSQFRRGAATRVTANDDTIYSLFMYF